MTLSSTTRETFVPLASLESPLRAAASTLCGRSSQRGEGCKGEEKRGREGGSGGTGGRGRTVVGGEAEKRERENIFLEEDEFDYGAACFSAKDGGL